METVSISNDPNGDVRKPLPRSGPVMRLQWDPGCKERRFSSSLSFLLDSTVREKERLRGRHRVKQCSGQSSIWFFLSFSRCLYKVTAERILPWSR